MSDRYSTSRVRVPSVIASTQISDRPLPPFVRSWRPFARGLNEPSSWYQMASDSGVSAFRKSSLKNLPSAR